MPGYTASHSACKKTTNLRAKFYGKTALNGEIPVSKYQNNINHIVILLASLPWMKTEHFMVSTLDFFRVFKTFFPKFELLNSGCGLSASAAYLRVFMVFKQVIHMYSAVQLKTMKVTTLA